MKAGNHYDFDPKNGNLERMIREAEMQSADVVAGSSVNENGHWDKSCLQFRIRPWDLTIQNGYHKSLRGSMYCDGSFGPLMMRKSAFERLSELESENLQQIFLQFFLRNRDLRYITIPDCMFYVKAPPSPKREDFLLFAQTFSFNQVTIEGKTFEFTCQEERVEIFD